MNPENPAKPANPGKVARPKSARPAQPPEPSPSLILDETVLSGFNRGAGERPGVAVTYSTAQGVRRAGTLRAGLRCKVRYEIDMSDRRDQVEWSLPSRDERVFRVHIGIGWHVIDPCEVTARQLADGFTVIRGYLQPVVRRMSRQYVIEQVHELEDELNQLLARGPARFVEGLEVFHLDAQVESDELTVIHAGEMRTIARESTVAGQRHTAELDAEHYKIERETTRRRALERMVAGENGLLLHHLTVHPDDTMAVLGVLQQQNQASAEARARLLEQFRDRLLPEELDGLAELLIQHTRDSIERPAATQLTSNHTPPAIVAGSSEPAGPTSEPPSRRNPNGAVQW